MIDGSTATIPLSEAIAATGWGFPPAKRPASSPTTPPNSAYINLLQNKADLIFVTYPSRG
jgi:phosphate transport system substrate-binding protein